MTAQALERKGIISDRCELNRQIKADNTLLRELKATVKKLMQAVKNTVPAISEAMERLRMNMIIFRYQLRHIGIGKHRITEYLGSLKQEYERYMVPAGQIKDKTKKRKDLLVEKKGTPFYLVSTQRDLSRQISELTEELEKLKSEKDMLLQALEYSDEEGIAAVKKDISKMESALKKLSEQEEKYAAELNDALHQYNKLKEQASEIDPLTLLDARFELRPKMEQSAVSRIQTAYGEKYDVFRMYESKRDVSNLLHEDEEERTARQIAMQRQKSEQQPVKHKKPKKRDDWAGL